MKTWITSQTLEVQSSDFGAMLELRMNSQYIDIYKIVQGLLFYKQTSELCTRKDCLLKFKVQ